MPLPNRAQHDPSECQYLASKYYKGLALTQEITTHQTADQTQEAKENQFVDMLGATARKQLFMAMRSYVVRPAKCKSHCGSSNRCETSGWWNAWIVTGRILMRGGQAVPGTRTNNRYPKYNIHNNICIINQNKGNKAKNTEENLNRSID